MKKALALLLAVFLLGSLATVCYAGDFSGDSQAVDPEYKVHVIYDFQIPEDGGTVEVKPGNTVVITPKDKDGYIFDHYDITGDYEIVSKDGNSWTIMPKSSLTIHVKYKGVNPPPNDDKPVSPSTGANVPLYAALVLFGLCGVVVATRKLVKNH